MGHLHNFNHKRQPSMVQSIGSKIKNAAELVALAKGAWDIGRTISSRSNNSPNYWSGNWGSVNLNF